MGEGFRQASDDATEVEEELVGAESLPKAGSSRPVSPGEPAFGSLRLRTMTLSESSASHKVGSARFCDYDKVVAFNRLRARSGAEKRSEQNPSATNYTCLLHQKMPQPRKHSDPSLVVDSHHTMLATVLGGSKEEAAVSILYSYKHGFSGFAARLTDSQAHMIAEMDGVIDVIPTGLVKLHTTRSWDSLGLSFLPAANNLLTKSNMGDGTIIGVIDSTLSLSHWAMKLYCRTHQSKIIAAV